MINVKMVQICCSISLPRLHISKNPSVMRCSIWCSLTNFSLNFKNRNSKSKKRILVTLSITVTCCTTIYILIRSPLKMLFLHLLRKCHGYIFNGLGEKWIWKLSPAVLPVDLDIGHNLFQINVSLFTMYLFFIRFFFLFCNVGKML